MALEKHNPAEESSDKRSVQIWPQEITTTKTKLFLSYTASAEQSEDLLKHGDTMSQQRRMVPKKLNQK